MSKRITDLVKESYRVENNSLVAEGEGFPTVLSAEDCRERLDTYQQFILKSPALGTLSREVEVPDRHTVRTIIEEMNECVKTGVSPAQLGFWIAELESVEPRD